ncbi:MAG: CHAT domain-containing protein [Gammaproteobacteria bacterium]|nr:CHAT domain-containing protein [Gammaproteobacteria bacterium]
MHHQSLEQGRSSLESGQYLAAIRHFKTYIEHARKVQNPERELRALTLLALAYRRLYDGKNENEVLHRIQELAPSLQNRVAANTAYDFLAKSYLSRRQFSQARDFFHILVQDYRTQGENLALAKILLDIGYTDVQVKDWQLAEQAFSESLDLAQRLNDSKIEIIAALNLARVKLQMGSLDGVSTLLGDLVSTLDTVNDYAFTIEHCLNLGSLYRDFSKRSKNKGVWRKRALQQYQNALSLAENTKDLRSLSYAWGMSAILYRDEGRFAEALHMFRQASIFAHKSDSPDSMYRWDIELAILADIAKDDNAGQLMHAAHNQLRNLLEQVAHNEPDAYAMIVRPFIEQYLSFLAQDKSPESARRAWQAMETLRMSEAMSRFPLVSETTSHTLLPELASNDARFYNFIGKNKSFVVLQKGKEYLFHQLRAKRDQIYQNVVDMRAAIEREYDITPSSIKLYKLFLAPFEKALQTVNTLAFSLDGLTRAIPVASLYTGKKYLVEKYSLSYFHATGLRNMSWGTKDVSMSDSERAEFFSKGISKTFSGLGNLPLAGLLAPGFRLWYTSQHFEIDSPSNVSDIDKSYSIEELEVSLREFLSTGGYDVLVMGEYANAPDESVLTLLPIRFSVSFCLTPMWQQEKGKEFLQKLISTVPQKFSPIDAVRDIQVAMIKEKQPAKYWAGLMVTTH